VARRPLPVRDYPVSRKLALRRDDATGEHGPVTLPLEFDQVFRLHAPYVGALVLKLIGRPGYVDDVVQDVFIQAHRGLRKLRDPELVRPWLRRIAVRRARRWLRKRWVLRWLRERDVDAYRQRAFELSVAGYFADPRKATDLTPFRVIGRIQQSVWASLGDFNLIRELNGIKIPSIIIHGRDDPIPLASSSEAAHALGTELVVLDDCGHVPYVEQPDRLFAALEPFLDETNPPVRS